MAEGSGTETKKKEKQRKSNIKKNRICSCNEQLLAKLAETRQSLQTLVTEKFS